VTLANKPTEEPLPGYKVIHPMVFSGIYPINTADFEKLKASLEKVQHQRQLLRLHAGILGRAGAGLPLRFLGLLHMEIVQERLRREYDVDIISTYPNVVYRCTPRTDRCRNWRIRPSCRTPAACEAIEEPMIKAFLICHNEHIGDICS
jgi:GTP-binding protein LepA